MYAGWLGRVRARRDAAACRLLPRLLAQPAVNIRFVRESLRVSEPAADNAVRQLVDAGVLAPANSARRQRVWIAQEVIEALDAFPLGLVGVARADRTASPSEPATW